MWGRLWPGRQSWGRWHRNSQGRRWPGRQERRSRWSRSTPRSTFRSHRRWPPPGSGRPPRPGYGRQRRRHSAGKTCFRPGWGCCRPAMTFPRPARAMPLSAPRLHRLQRPVALVVSSRILLCLRSPRCTCEPDTIGHERYVVDCSNIWSWLPSPQQRGRHGHRQRITRTSAAAPAQNLKRLLPLVKRLPGDPLNIFLSAPAPVPSQP